MTPTPTAFFIAILVGFAAFSAPAEAGGLTLEGRSAVVEVPPSIVPPSIHVGVEGETASGFVPPSIAVGINPPLEPPRHPLQVTLQWTFDEVVDLARIDLINATLHPPAPGEPVPLTFQ